MFPTTNLSWGDLTAEQQIQEWKWVAEVLERARPAASRAGDPAGLAAFYRRLAVEIRAGVPV